MLRFGKALVSDPLDWLSKAETTKGVVAQYFPKKDIMKVGDRVRLSDGQEAVVLDIRSKERGDEAPDLWVKLGPNQWYNADFLEVIP